MKILFVRKRPLMGQRREPAFRGRRFLLLPLIRLFVRRVIPSARRASRQSRQPKGVIFVLTSGPQRRRKTCRRIRPVTLPIMGLNCLLNVSDVES